MGACGASYPPIGSADEAEANVLRVFAENGCQMRLKDFEHRVVADEFVRPGNGAVLASGGALGTPDFERLTASSRVLTTPAILLDRGVLRTDPNDPRVAISTGEGCP